MKRVGSFVFPKVLKSGIIDTWNTIWRSSGAILNVNVNSNLEMDIVFNYHYGTVM
jgi:hypothetical protein